jgi:hypothetical protein
MACLGATVSVLKFGAHPLTKMARIYQENYPFCDQFAELVRYFAEVTAVFSGFSECDESYRTALCTYIRRGGFTQLFSYIRNYYCVYTLFLRIYLA